MPSTRGGDADAAAEVAEDEGGAEDNTEPTPNGGTSTCSHPPAAHTHRPTSRERYGGRRAWGEQRCSRMMSDEPSCGVLVCDVECAVWCCVDLLLCAVCARAAGGGVVGHGVVALLVLAGGGEVVVGAEWVSGGGGWAAAWLCVELECGLRCCSRHRGADGGCEECDLCEDGVASVGERDGEGGEGGEGRSRGSSRRCRRGSRLLLEWLLRLRLHVHIAVGVGCLGLKGGRRERRRCCGSARLGVLV